MTQDEYDKEWDRRATAIKDRAARLLPEGALVEYSAYEKDNGGLPRDNLDHVAVEGRCRFLQAYDSFYGEGEDYISEEVLNPTWIQVCRLANEMIKITGDTHHVYFEGVTVLREEGGVKFVDLDMGS